MNFDNLKLVSPVKMPDFVQFFSTILAIIAGCLLFSVCSFAIYWKIRRKFAISVNCWFCNGWSKVNYDDRNSFECPNCLQYNGFTKEGDYNKVIPEQHDELMNKGVRGERDKLVPANGLCSLCNNNQQLKIFQLAHFVPMVEENYDREVEHFQEQLEKAYKLCKKCDKVLKTTLSQQNPRIFGKKIQKLYNGATSTIKVLQNEATTGKLWGFLDGVIYITLVVFIFSIIALNQPLVRRSITNNLPGDYSQLYKELGAVSARTIKITVPFFTTSLHLQWYCMVCALGFFYQGVQCVLRGVSPVKVNRFLCWIILFLANCLEKNFSYAAHIFILQGFCCSYLSYTILTKERLPKPSVIKGRTMRKLVKNLEYTCTDFSDLTDLEDLSTSSPASLSPVCSSPSKRSTKRRTESITANSLLEAKNTDLNRSLNNLSLRGPFNAPSVNFAVKRPKPVLSPPKLQNVNSWVNGSYMRNPTQSQFGPYTNLSRGSSESSGFGSQFDNFAPRSQFGEIPRSQFGEIPRSQFGEAPRSQFGEAPRSQFGGEFEANARTSLSPSYLYAPFEHRNNHFYPNLQPNNMLFIRSGAASPLIRNYETCRAENWSDRINFQTTQSFRELNLRANN